MKNQWIFIVLLLCGLCHESVAQVDSILAHTDFELDFRFRVEQDWDSRKSDGTYRTNRSRFRYRLRTGATYSKNKYSFGFRIRTGDQNKQQDPQLTLGKGFKEFGTLPIGFEKLFFNYTSKNYTFWLGKNSFSFDKNNELFWSDNVFPEGLYLKRTIHFGETKGTQFTVQLGHYILASNGNSLSNDAYFQGLQTSLICFNKRLKIFPSIYLMRNIPNIPDGYASFELDYSIFHLGAKMKVLSSDKLWIDADYYHNLEDYSSNVFISTPFKNEKQGFSIGIQYGQLYNAKDWKIKVTYTSLQRYAALDYMAQNDWARWDYSVYNSPDGRLTNFQGAELVVAYNITKKVNIVSKYYLVNQLVPTGEYLETGQRIRFDLNAKI